MVNGKKSLKEIALEQGIELPKPKSLDEICPARFAEDEAWLNFDEGNLEPYDWGDINPDEIGEKIEW